MHQDNKSAHKAIIVNKYVLRIQQIGSNNHRTHLTWLRLTILFLKFKFPTWRNPISLNSSHKREFAAKTEVDYGKMHLKYVLMIGFFVGISELIQKKPTLKAIQSFWKNNQYIFFYLTISGTFLTECMSERPKSSP